MFSPDNFSSCSPVIEYTLPKLHKSKKDWYVDFYAHDPVTGRMKRKKVMLNRFGTAAAKNEMAALVINNLMNKLRRGWNPWVVTEESRHATPLKEVFGRYDQYLKAAEKKGVMRKKTVYDYSSRKKVFMEFLECHPVAYSYQLNSAYMVDFLDYLLLDRDVSARTWNNYRIWISSFGTWMLSRKYVPENPAANIRPLPEQAKFRKPLTREDLRRLSEHLRATNKLFLLACMFQYYTLIRPYEMGQIRIRDISVKNQTVFIASSISKNRRDGMVALNDRIIRLMIDLETFSRSGDCYLFGKGLLPSRERMTYNELRLEWVKVRKEMQFPDHYQFYSLKDSGIRDLITAEGAYAARNQARHSDLSITNRYAQDFGVQEEVKHFDGML